MCGCKFKTLHKLYQVRDFAYLDLSSISLRKSLLVQDIKDRFVSRACITYTDDELMRLFGMTREEYEKAWQQANNYFYGYDDEPQPEVDVEDMCDHDYKEYVGFVERYDYCTKCGDKKL